MKFTKNLCTVLLCISSIAISFAQTDLKEKEKSNAEKFSDKSGTVIQKEFIDVGDLKKCKIQIAKFTDLVSNQKTSAVRFEYSYVSSYSSDTKLALLDSDEIDGLIKSLKLVQEKILPTTATSYTEVSFRSRSGFEAGRYSKKNSWDFYMKLERYDGKSYVFLDKEDLPKLLSILEQAKASL
ncbi:hypothetical protein ACQ9BO_10580 [Flavobacterium sp. P21]|uniref:hypothetical protein n=1 Tax=Flavobacterium sp. P21 TaxID=3423948 RepID=UPI003D67E2D3